MAFGESPTGMAFQVSLEFCRFTPIGKCDGGLQSPGKILCRVRYFSGVVPSQSILQIVRQANIVSRRLDFADQDVDV